MNAIAAEDEAFEQRVREAGRRPVFPRTGHIHAANGYTFVSCWEETVDEEGMRAVLQSLLGRLRFRGFHVRQRQDVAKIIRSGYWRARKGDLEAIVEAAGRTCKVEFFQNLHTENIHGGQYDSRKYEKMPRTMQLQCIVEMAAVIGKFRELGYAFGHKLRALPENPTLNDIRHALFVRERWGTLACFNDQWDSEGDVKRGGHRFERDETGWPSAKELAGNSNRDRDGKPVRNGEERYVRARGRLLRGIARPNMNSMWFVGDFAIEPSGHLFFCDRPDLEPRRLVPSQPERVRAELEKALKKNDYRRVRVLAGVLDRLLAKAARLAAQKESP